MDAATHFTRAFRPFGGYEFRGANVYPALAAIIAHGTDLGIVAMGQSGQCLTADTLQHDSQWFLREETSKAANAALVDYHHGLPLSAVWELRIASSSDGERWTPTSHGSSGISACEYRAWLKDRTAPANIIIHDARTRGEDDLHSAL